MTTRPLFTRADFDGLPVLFAYPDLRAKLGIPFHRVTIWAMVRAGTFPPPRHLGPKRHVWHREDLLVWFGPRDAEGE